MATVGIDGGVVGYEREGEGPPLVVINGFAATRADWDPSFIAGLAESFDVVRLDNRGMGESNGGGEPFTIEDCAGDVAAAISALQLDRPAVLGWSMGGCIALALALARPEAVGGLVLLATTPGGPGSEPVSGEALDAIGDFSVSPREQASRLISLLFLPERAAEIDAAFGDVVAEARGALDPAVVARQRQALDEWDAGDGLGEIGVPALVAMGAGDAVIPPANSDKLAAAHPGRPACLLSRLRARVHGRPPEIARLARRIIRCRTEVGPYATVPSPSCASETNEAKGIAEMTDRERKEAKRSELVGALAGILTGIIFVLAGAAAQASAASGVNEKRLPVGDGQISTTTPARDFIYLCNQGGNGGGASTQGPWFNGDGTWDATKKVFVDGSVDWPTATFSEGISGSQRVLSGNGLPPDHKTGTFPISSSDDAYLYDRNPNTISSQTLNYTLPAQPEKTSAPNCMSGSVGVAKNGVPIFNGLDAGNRDAAAWEVQDECGGHPQQAGQYHYHSIPACMNEGESKKDHSKLVGWALDGFPIYGPRGEDGEELTNDDLDVCHGHTHKVKLDGEKVRTYHYHGTAEYPYTVGCFRGTPVR